MIEEYDAAWSDYYEGCRVRFKTPNFVKIGTVLKRKGASMRIQFDGEAKDTVLPDARHYALRYKAGDRDEYLVMVKGADAPTKTETLEDEGTDLVDVPHAANLFGVAQKDLRRWLRSGKVKGHQAQDGRWRIEYAALSRFLSNR